MKRQHTGPLNRSSSNSPNNHTTTLKMSALFSFSSICFFYLLSSSVFFLPSHSSHPVPPFLESLGGAIIPLLLRQPIFSSSPSSASPLKLPQGSPSPSSAQPTVPLEEDVDNSDQKEEEGVSERRRKREEGDGGGGAVGIGSSVVAQIARTSGRGSSASRGAASAAKASERNSSGQLVKGRVLVALSELSHKRPEGAGGEEGGSLGKLEEALQSSGTVGAAAVRIAEAVGTPSPPGRKSAPAASATNKHATDNGPDQIIRSYRVLRNVGLVIIDFHPLVTAAEVEAEVAALWRDHPEVWMIEADAEVSFRDGASGDGVSDGGGGVGGGGGDAAVKAEEEGGDVVVETSENLSAPSLLDIPLLPSLFPSDLAESVLSDVAALARKATRGTSSDTLPSPSASRADMTAGVVPTDSLFSQQWALLNTAAPFVDVRAPTAWSLVYEPTTGRRKVGSGGIHIAHIDTGCDVNHPDLVNNIWVNPREIPGNGIDDDGNGFVDDINGWNFDGDDNNVRDEHGHGTHTAGLLGAESNNRKGIAGLIWDAKLIILKFKNNVSDAVQAIEYCLSMNIPVSTNSWGFNAPVESLRLVLEKTNQRNHLFVCAVDNKGRDNTWFNDFPPNYAFPNMIRVASINSNADLDVTSDFSKTKVDIAAPGNSIISTVPREIYGSLYARKDGTSMATPLVAGLASLMLSTAPNLDIYEVRSLMMSTVTPLAAIESRILTGGIINCENAIKAVLGLPFVPAAQVSSSSGGRVALSSAASELGLLEGGGPAAAAAGQVSEMLFAGFNDFMSGFLARYSRSVNSLLRRSVAAAAVANQLDKIVQDATDDPLLLITNN
eukprot:GHVS01079132.1.p1 GENE.GHVS01079132.1~~GHVS01079132.1.p1  ORF type:complete len:835 (+),score=219.82 GHVS01079132.1:371-2875(+)